MKNFFIATFFSSFLAISFFAFSSDVNAADYSIEANSSFNEKEFESDDLNFEKEKSIQPFMITADVRNTFKKDLIESRYWSDRYDITYKQIMFQTGFDQLTPTVTNIDNPWWSNTAVYSYRDNYNTY